MKSLEPPAAIPGNRTAHRLYDETLTARTPPHAAVVAPHGTAGQRTLQPADHKTPEVVIRILIGLEAIVVLGVLILQSPGGTSSPPLPFCFAIGALGWVGVLALRRRVRQASG